MPSKPVAILSLDTRSYGPAYCAKCDEETENALLMSDAQVVCPTCRTPVRGWGFEQFSDAVVSAAPAPKR